MHAIRLENIVIMNRSKYCVMAILYGTALQDNILTKLVEMCIPCRSKSLQVKIRNKEKV